MTTATRIDLRCQHVEGAVCWLCSDQVVWWREARLRAGLGARPPIYWRYGRQFARHQ